MLPSPFFSEIPYGLGDDTAWLGRDVMQALQLLRRHQYTDIHSAHLAATDRRFRWPQSLRPDDHPGLSEHDL
jgi:nuclear transport factor 2 (NTF2) superfamily protein